MLVAFACLIYGFWEQGNWGLSVLCAFMLGIGAVQFYYEWRAGSLNEL